MKDLLEMLTYARPHGSNSEQAFVNKYITPIAPDNDTIGNHYLRIGTLPILWSCHTDTMDRGETKKKIQVTTTNAHTAASLSNGKAGTCLGADDTVGVWIMKHMIAAKRPGLYIFHRGEERGGLGSQWIATHKPETLSDISAAIAFDRKGTQSIITHQLGMRCCSERFSNELADILNLNYRSDSTGLFTDTANYTHLISECTNLSVGYEREHGPTETLNLDHAQALREVMLKANFSDLGAYRDPTPDLDYSLRDTPRADKYRSNFDDLTDLVLDYPDIAAELLRQCGLDERNFLDAINYGT